MSAVQQIRISLESAGLAKFFENGDNGAYFLQVTAEDIMGELVVFDGKMEELGAFRLITNATAYIYCVTIVHVAGYVALNLFTLNGEPNAPELIYFEGGEVQLGWRGESSDLAYLDGIFYLD